MLHRGKYKLDCRTGVLLQPLPLLCLPVHAKQTSWKGANRFFLFFPLWIWLASFYSCKQSLGLAFIIVNIPYLVSYMKPLNTHWRMVKGHSQKDEEEDSKKIVSFFHIHTDAWQADTRRTTQTGRRNFFSTNLVGMVTASQLAACVVFVFSKRSSHHYLIAS